MSKTSLALLCALVALSQAQVKDRYYLDLTKPATHHKEPQTVTGGGGGTSAPRPELGMSLYIETLNRKSYEKGEVIISEARLVNTSSKPIAIPWSTDLCIVNGCDGSAPTGRGQRTLDATLSLEFIDPAGIRFGTFAVALFARMDDRNTYRTLEPNDSAVVKFGGPLQPGSAILSGPVNYESKLPQEFTVTASYSLHDSALGNRYQDVHSKNQLRVSVQN